MEVATHTLPGEAAAPKAAHQAVERQGWQDSWCGVLALHSSACYSPCVSAVLGPGGLGALGQGCTSPSPSPFTQIKSHKPVPSICAKSTCVVFINGTLMSFFLLLALITPGAQPPPCAHVPGMSPC